MASGHRRPGGRSAGVLLPLAAAAASAALALRGLSAAVAFAGAPPALRAPRAPRAPRVHRQFLGGESDPAPQKTSTGSANAEDVTFADQLKDFWKNPTVQQAFGLLMTASTVLDVFGLFTGEAAVGGGVAEALGTVDATALATEGQGAVEALAEAAESATEATEGAMDSVKEMITGAKKAP